MQVSGGRARVYARAGHVLVTPGPCPGFPGVDLGFPGARKAAREATLDSRIGGVAHGIPRDHDHSRSGRDV
jgi:hypothetical protein